MASINRLFQIFAGGILLAAVLYAQPTAGSGAPAAPPIPPGFQVQPGARPGQPLTITGPGLANVTTVKLKPADGPELTAGDVTPTPTSVKFTVPANASGNYTVTLSPGAIPPIPLTVTPAASPAASASTKPAIDSVFPTTAYPIQNRFNFEINGKHFDPDPTKNQVEVEGQGPITFGSRYREPVAGSPHEADAPVDCKTETKLPCLQASADGGRLFVYGYSRRYFYHAAIKVRVVVGADTSEWSNFTLSHLDYRIVITLAIVLFLLLMYIVYRLVSKGTQPYVIAGKKYSPLAAFFIDKGTDSYSLSKFQLFALSLVAFFGYVYVLLCRILIQSNFAFPEIPENYPSFLAISAGTAAAAAGLAATRGGKGGGPVLPSAADFISNGGLVVAERFQFFVWTLIACIGFVALLLMKDPAKVDGFPAFPSGLLYVMGVSAAGYLGGKAVRNPGPILRQVKVGKNAANNTDMDVTLVGENLDKNAKFRIDGALQTLVGAVNDTPQPQAPQGYSTQLIFTLSQAAGFLSGDHVFEITNGDGIGAQANFTATPMKIVPSAAAPAIARGTKGPVTLTVENYRDGCSARWLPPGVSAPVDIPAGDDVKKTASAPAGTTVVVTVTAGDKLGSGTLTLVSPVGGTESTSVTVT